MDHETSEFWPRRFFCVNTKGPVCQRGFKTLGGYQQHRNSVHIDPPHPTRPRQHSFVHDEDIPQGAYYIQHPVLDGMPCDVEGHDIHPQHPPPEPHTPQDNTWNPFPSCGHFELADFLFRRNQTPAAQVDDLMQVLASFEENHGHPPFHSDTHLLDTIDSITSHDVPWQSLSLRHPDYEANLNDEDVPPWKHAEFDVWYRDPCKLLKNQLSNLEFVDGIDYAL